MKIGDKEQIQRDISEAFDFVRFIVKKPKMLNKIKDGSEIQFLPTMSGKAPRSSHMSKNIQAFATEMVFHTL